MEKTAENIEEIINYFAISLFGQSTVDEILWDLVKNCISKLDFEDCVIYLVDEERNVLIQKAAYGPKNPKDQTIYQPIEIPLGKGIVGNVAKQGYPEIVPDTTKDTRYIQDDQFRFSEISVPIILHGKVIGVIDSEHSQRDFFTEWHLRTLTLIASLCANKLMWAKAEENIRREQKALQETQQKLSEFKLQALRSQMNPHFIFNSLNTIQYFITEKESGDALTYLSLFGKFIRKILSSSNASFITLGMEVEMLSMYLALEKMRFGERFDFEVVVDSSIDVHAIELPVLLLHPFVEHALTEGLLNRQKIGVLTVGFAIDVDGLRCTIKNTELNSPDHFHMSVRRDAGVNNGTWWEVHERIDLLNQLYDTNIRVNLVGTRIEIIVPLQIRSA